MRSDSADTANRATGFAQRALEDRRFDEAAHHARCAMQHPADRSRCLYLLSITYKRSGQKRTARSTTQELLNEWLDASPIPLPGVHPRKAIDRDELISLLELVEGSNAAPLIKSVREAPELDEPSGDSFFDGAEPEAVLTAGGPDKGGSYDSLRDAFVRDYKHRGEEFVLSVREEAKKKTA